MNSPTPPPEIQPPASPRLYRLFAALLGPMEKLLGLTCRDFTRLASARLDRPLAGGERRRYFLHRLMCDVCRRQEKRLLQLNHLAGEAIRRTGDDTHVKLPDAARDRIRDRVAQELGPD